MTRVPHPACEAVKHSDWQIASPAWLGSILYQQCVGLVFAYDTPKPSDGKPAALAARSLTSAALVSIAQDRPARELSLLPMPPLWMIAAIKHR